jgi:hypothetical protein
MPLPTLLPLVTQVSVYKQELNVVFPSCRPLPGAWILEAAVSY